MMSVDDVDWKEDIRSKLLDLFSDDPETCVRILFYLDEEEKAYSVHISPVWKTLKSAASKSDGIFKAYANKLAEDTKQAEKDVKFRKVMQTMYASMVDASEDCESDGKRFQLAPSETNAISAFPGMASAWAMLSVEGRAMFVSFFNSAGGRSALSVADEFAGLVSTKGAVMVTAVLSGVYLSVVALRSIMRWYKGEISGVRCIKTIVDTSGSVSGGIGLGVAGAAFGTLIGGPIGAFICGLIGSLVGSYGAGKLSDYLTQKLFNVPQDEALENAYRYLGITCSVSNDEVNKAFRKLCLKHHPDKGGSIQDFFTLQSHMALIKVNREM